MIYSSLKNASFYYCHGPLFKKALDWLKTEAGTISDGVYVLQEGELTAHVVSKDTKRPEDCQMEIHKKFIDLHYVIKGTEACGLCSAFHGIGEYDEAGDIQFSDDKDDSIITCHEGEFYAVWPEEPHKPLLMAGTKKENIRKVIFKILS